MIDKNECTDYNDLEEQVFNTVLHLAEAMLRQSPIDAMQTSQAALNLSNALAVLDRLTSSSVVSKAPMDAF